MLTIYCTSIKYFNVLDKLPSYVKVIGLGDRVFPNHWLNESSGKNIKNLNKYYGELTAFYWIWKNKLNEFNDNDLIGFCHYRKLWLNELFHEKNNKSVKSLYSNLLNKENALLKQKDVLQVQPIVFKKKNLIEDFSKIHNTDIIHECLNFLPTEIKFNFLSHLNSNILYPLNMFIAKKDLFNEYCKILFPWMEQCMELFLKKNILVSYNTRLPAFLAERFTSFWFSQNLNRSNLSYARLGKFFLSNKVNRFINPIKLPFTSKMYPTLHKY